MIPFNTYSLYYDLLYRDKDYKSEADYLLQLFETHGHNIRSVLELGSGSGAHASFICNAGIKVTGIERSEQMVQQSLSKQIKGFTPVQGDISSFSLNRQFDAAISLFHVMSYLTSNEDLIRCFETTNKHLKPGGLFIFDVWYSPAVYHQKPERRVKQMENDLIRVERTAIPETDTNRNIVTVNFKIDIYNKQTGTSEQLSESHPMRHFSIPEIELLSTLTGFKMIKTEEFLTAKTPDENTWGVCFVLQKI